MAGKMRKMSRGLLLDREARPANSDRRMQIAVEMDDRAGKMHGIDNEIESQCHSIWDEHCRSLQPRYSLLARGWRGRTGRTAKGRYLWLTMRQHLKSRIGY